MKVRSHSRKSYSFDKRLPVEQVTKERFYLASNGYLSSKKRSSASKAVDKAMHKKKQREHNRKLARQEYESYYTKF